MFHLVGRIVGVGHNLFGIVHVVHQRVVVGVCMCFGRECSPTVLRFHLGAWDLQPSCPALVVPSWESTFVVAWRDPLTAAVAGRRSWASHQWDQSDPWHKIDALNLIGIDTCRQYWTPPWWTSYVVDQVGSLSILTFVFWLYILKNISTISINKMNDIAQDLKLLWHTIVSLRIQHCLLGIVFNYVT